MELCVDMPLPRKATTIKRYAIATDYPVVTDQTLYSRKVWRTVIAPDVREHIPPTCCGARRLYQQMEPQRVPDHGDVEESGGGRSGAESYVECSRLTWLYGDVIEPTNCLYLTTLHQVIQSLACLLAFNLGRNT